MSSDLYKIRPEQAGDFPGICNLYSATLGDGEAELVDRLRRDGDFSPTMSLVAVAGNIVLGHILFSDLGLAGRNGNKIKGACLAPMAVLPDCQKMGIGSALVERGLKVLEELGYEAVIVLGHIEYYPRFGFSIELGKKIQCQHSGKHLMVKELRIGVLENEKKIAAVYPKAFSAFRD